MKPATAAKKLGVHLDATPDEFRAGLRRNGPHPRQVVADRLGVSISGLARAEITEPLTTAQIAALKEEQPEWLRRERGTRADAQREEVRLRTERSKKRRDDPVGK
jgi:hypothetical protein